VIRPTGLLDPVIEVREAHTQVADILNEAKKVIAKNQRVLITTLTKKLSEELTDFFTKNQMRIRYLHSDIDALERVEILKSLRKGDFDILVGINLLREGLDLPEVSLVGILDADKEGFLRSKRSLIQTMGRAARNIDGKVIMYAYKMTPSMEGAIQETVRRRAIQHQYNLDHHTDPQSLGQKRLINVGNAGEKQSKEDNISQMQMSNEEIDLKIIKLKQEMKKCSEELNYEHALVIRDKIKKLAQLRLMN
jgi:excinuclease ABC subunit B